MDRIEEIRKRFDDIVTDIYIALSMGYMGIVVSTMWMEIEFSRLKCQQEIMKANAEAQRREFELQGEEEWIG